MKICIIDDTPKMVEKMVKIFEKGDRKFDILVAKDGLEGKELIKNNPDLKIAIVDFYMTQMDGLEMVKSLIEEEIELPPIMFVTTEVSHDVRVEGGKYGIKFWMVKPIVDDIFYDAVLNIINKEHSS